MKYFRFLDISINDSVNHSINPADPLLKKSNILSKNDKSNDFSTEPPRPISPLTISVMIPINNSPFEIRLSGIRNSITLIKEPTTPRPILSTVNNSVNIDSTAFPTASLSLNFSDSVCSIPIRPLAVFSADLGNTLLNARPTPSMIISNDFQAFPNISNKTFRPSSLLNASATFMICVGITSNAEPNSFANGVHILAASS